MEKSDEIFELMTKMYSEMQGMKTDMQDIKTDIKDMKKDIAKTNMIIEQDIQPKITALFDGYKQHTEQLERIEIQVTKHEEILVRKIK